MRPSLMRHAIVSMAQIEASRQKRINEAVRSSSFGMIWGWFASAVGRMRASECSATLARIHPDKKKV
jgi:hypothetical protein